MPQIALAFQPNLLGVMSQFSQFAGILDKYIATATEKSAGLIGTAGQGNMHWKNPTGELYDSIEVQMQNPYLAYIGSNLPYAWRRERGFSGMTDSLGRFYPNDPGQYYMEIAINDTTVLQEVAEIYIQAVYDAWGEAVGSIPPGSMVMVTRNETLSYPVGP